MGSRKYSLRKMDQDTTDINKKDITQNQLLLRKTWKWVKFWDQNSI